MLRLPDKRILGTITIAAAAVFVLAWIVFFWQLGEVGNISEDYQKEKLNSLIQEEKRKKFAALKKEISNFEEQNKKLDALFIEKENVLVFLEELENVARTAACEIKISPIDVSKIKFEKKKAQKTERPPADDELAEAKGKNSDEPVPPPPPVDELADIKNFPAFTIEVTGAYPAVFDFLEKAENLPYFIRPLTLDVSDAGTQKKTSAADGSLKSQAPNVAGEQGAEQSEQEAAETNNVKLVFTAVIYAR